MQNTLNRARKENHIKSIRCNSFSCRDVVS